MEKSNSPEIDSPEWLAAVDVPNDQRDAVSRERKQDWWNRKVGGTRTGGLSGKMKTGTMNFLSDKQKEDYEKLKETWNYDDKGNIIYDYSSADLVNSEYIEQSRIDRCSDDEYPQTGKRGGRFRIRLNKEGKPYRHYY